MCPGAKISPLASKFGLLSIAIRAASEIDLEEAKVRRDRDGRVGELSRLCISASCEDVGRTADSMNRKDRRSQLGVLDLLPSLFMDAAPL